MHAALPVRHSHSLSPFGNELEICTLETEARYLIICRFIKLYETNWVDLFTESETSDDP